MPAFDCGLETLTPVQRSDPSIYDSKALAGHAISTTHHISRTRSELSAYQSIRFNLWLDKETPERTPSPTKPRPDVGEILLMSLRSLNQLICRPVADRASRSSHGAQRKVFKKNGATRRKVRIGRRARIEKWCFTELLFRRFKPHPCMHCVSPQTDSRLNSLKRRSLEADT